MRAELVIGYVPIMSDITQLIMNDHEELRRRFAELDDARGTERVGDLWAGIAILLEAHAAAEENVFYPALLKRGDDGEEAAEDAVHDHNEIREGVAEAEKHEVGSDAWWEAVYKARDENSDHLAEEEREALPDFRRNASLDLRARLGREFEEFRYQYPRGDVPAPTDAETYIAEHS